MRVAVRHRAGLSEDQCEREYAEPRGIPTASQELDLCHIEEYSLDNRARHHLTKLAFSQHLRSKGTGCTVNALASAQETNGALINLIKTALLSAELAAVFTARVEAGTARERVAERHGARVTAKFRDAATSGGTGVAPSLVLNP